MKAKAEASRMHEACHFAVRNATIKRSMKTASLSWWVILLLLTAAHSQTTAQKAPARVKRTPEYTFTIVQSFPHDPNAFTQGLEYHNGYMYEGTGLYGRSSLRKVRLETGEILKQVDLSPEYFGEGITVVKDKILELTWKSEIGFVYNLDDFRAVRQFSYPGEGWGLTNNGAEIFMSDGSSQIRVLDPETLKEKRRIDVHEGLNAVDQLNELEWVEGELYANIWQTDRIARISPKTGEVVGWIDLTGLLSPIYRRDSDAVLNGIAFDSAHKRLFVTGKLWPKIFEIKVVRKGK
jgi:glutaminyl-peptide cyclotransferase